MRLIRVVAASLVPALAALVVGESVAQPVPETMYQGLRWRMIGPFRGGRTRAVAGVPSQPGVFYTGAVNGGVWKTDDFGHTWRPVFDAQPTQSIGDIAVAPSDPSIVYVASGEGLHRPDLSVGNGIYRSADAGRTWTYLNTLRDGQQIPRLAIDPNDPDRLFAAVLGHPYGPNEERGIFRSTDGGRSWTKVLYRDANTGGYDVAIDPARPGIVYATLWGSRLGPWEDGNAYDATTGGLFKSTDGGTTWRRLTNGLPETLVQADIAIALSQPKRLYLTFSTTAPSAYATNEGLGFYRSDDRGESWHKATDDPRSAMKIGGGDLPIAEVDPANPDVVYSCGIILAKSTDGGGTWSSFKGAPGGDDYQNLWINPNNPDIMLLAADQGTAVTVNGGRTWSSWYNQPTAQLYHAITTSEWPYKVCAGQQESGSVCITSRGNDGYISNRDWHPVNVIEYGYVAPDPLHPDIIFGAGRNVVTRYDWKTGQTRNVTPLPVQGDHRTERTEPLVFSPIDNRTLYYATNVLFKTVDYGQTWQTISPDLSHPNPGIPSGVGSMADGDKTAAKKRGAIYSVAPSFKAIETIWAGSDDGRIWITRDGGRIWKDITPPGLTPWSKVSQIQASHYDDSTAYASVSRFRVDDLAPYIYRTRDGGRSWRLIVEGLDKSPVNTVREDPVRKGLLFAGTETGVWVSFDDGGLWLRLQLNLPHSSMRDLWIHDNDLIVATHGRSFWILDDISPLRQATAAAANEDILFTPATAIRARQSTYAETPIPPDEPLAQNPPCGAVIDYSLARPAVGAVKIEILDRSGKIIRAFASDDPPEITPEQLQKQMIPPYWVRPSGNPESTAGMHRFVWDLHYEKPASVTHEYPITAVPGDTPRHPLGPVAVPGLYTVRLTAGGQSRTAPLTVKLDPRVQVPPAGLQQMFTLQQRLAGLVDRSSRAVFQAVSLRQQATRLEATGAPADALKTFTAKVSAALDGPENPPAAGPKPAALNDVNGDAYSLYGMVGQVDAAPTAAQLAAAAKIEHDLAAVVGAWEETLKSELPALNARMKQAGLPELDPEKKPEKGETQGNEE
ncbi:MAG TPA: glycoside hydrolase [Candidatus Polarisedimenticolia bacterium]|nr:glycoside hydrolase [Candidatus Polarisedimenticolia bacterium]